MTGGSDRERQCEGGATETKTMRWGSDRDKDNEMGERQRQRQ